MFADQILDCFGVRQLWQQLTDYITSTTQASQALATTENPGLMSADDKIDLLPITDEQIEALFPTEHPQNQEGN